MNKQEYDTEFDDEVIGIVQSALCKWGCEQKLADSANALAKEIIDQILALNHCIQLRKDSEVVINSYGRKVKYKWIWQPHIAVLDLIRLVNCEEDTHFIRQRLSIQDCSFDVSGNHSLEVIVNNEEDFAKIPKFIEWHLKESFWGTLDVFIELEPVLKSSFQDRAKNLMSLAKNSLNYNALKDGLEKATTEEEKTVLLHKLSTIEKYIS